MSDTSADYPVEARATIAEVPGLRVRRLALGPGQSVPWHHHSNITDTFFCMEGPMQVLTRDPRATHVLDPGASCSVGGGRV